MEYIKRNYTNIILTVIGGLLALIAFTMPNVEHIEGQLARIKADNEIALERIRKELVNNTINTAQFRYIDVSESF